MRYQVRRVVADGGMRRGGELAGVRSEHWGPTVLRSDDLGQTWEESERAEPTPPHSPGEFKAAFVSQYEQWDKFIRTSGISLE